MRKIGEWKSFEYLLYTENESTYLLCSLGHNMYMFMSPRRKDISEPTISGTRSCWACGGETQYGKFCSSGLFIGHQLVQRHPVYVCNQCINCILSGWSNIRKNALSEGVAVHI